MNKLFVYGSLQPQGPNAHVLAPVKGSWQPGFVEGDLVQIGWGASLGYPGLRLRAGGPQVPGSLLTSDLLTDHLTLLDEFEGAEYERVVAPISLRDGRIENAFVYVLAGS